VSAASDVLRFPARIPLAAGGGWELGDFQNGRGATVEVFSRSGMNLIGALLLLIIAFAIYALWDVAIERWFG
jgi:hypothetical protein